MHPECCWNWTFLHIQRGTKRVETTEMGLEGGSSWAITAVGETGTTARPFYSLPFDAGFAVRSFKGIQHPQLYIGKRTKPKCQCTLSNWCDLVRHNHTWNTFTAHTENHFKCLYLVWKVNWNEECHMIWEFQIPVTTKAGCSFFQGMSIFLLPENDKQA